MLFVFVKMFCVTNIYLFLYKMLFSKTETETCVDHLLKNVILFFRNF